MIVISSDFDFATEIIDTSVSKIVLERVKDYYYKWNPYNKIKRPKLLKPIKEKNIMMICFDPTDQQDTQAAMDLAASMSADSAEVAAPKTKKPRIRRTAAKIAEDNAAEAAAKGEQTTLPEINKAGLIKTLTEAAAIHGRDKIDKILKGKQLSEINMKHYAAISKQVKELEIEPPEDNEEDDW